jgi:uncharacterized protein YkwD
MSNPMFLLPFVLGVLLTISGGVSVAGSITDYLSPMERELVDEMNFARTHPHQYADYLVAMRQYYRRHFIEVPGEIAIETREGVAGIDEAIRFLRTVQPVPALIPSPGMSKAAGDHVQDQGPAGLLGHSGTDGSQFGMRLNRYGEWLYHTGENIAYGQREARRIIINQIIDDGQEGRGHRRNLFNPDFRIVGVACGEHENYRWMCVMELTADYTEKNG